MFDHSSSKRPGPHFTIIRWWYVIDFMSLLKRINKGRVNFRNMAKKLKERKVNLKTLQNESKSEIRKNLAWKIQIHFNFEKTWKDLLKNLAQNMQVYHEILRNYHVTRYKDWSMLSILKHFSNDSKYRSSVSKVPQFCSLATVKLL